MLVIKSSLFNRFPNISFGFSTKIGLERNSPYFFNLSHSVGDNESFVDENRAAFAGSLGLNTSELTYQKQVHSDIISLSVNSGNVGESDAIVTEKTGLGIAISSADCTALFIYDSVNRVIAGIHAGWKGTQKDITSKVLHFLKREFNSRPENLFVYIAPSISQENYEVGEEVGKLFDKKYLTRTNSRIYLDVAGKNYNELFESGVLNKNIQKSNLCSFREKNLLHSYRRDGQASGRAWGIIAMKNNE